MTFQIFSHEELSMSKPDFPAVIDSSMRGTFAACEKKFYWNYLRHLHRAEESPDLKAGGAFARGLEVARKAFWGDKLPADEALSIGLRALLEEFGDYEPPYGHPKTPDRMAEALVEYFHHYGWSTDLIQPFMHEGKPSVEFTFALPLDIAHPQTGEPILYAGRFDMLGERDGILYVVDEKTTKQLGATWPKQWTMRSQLTGYCWAARTFGYPVAGAIVRGISILKRGFGHAESIQPRAEWEIDRWYAQLHRNITKMIESWKADDFEYDLDSACSSYGGCPYITLCQSNDPERWVSAEYVVKPWNPLETKTEAA